MCGFSGVLSLRDVNLSRFEMMHEEIRSRGPDESGVIFEDTIALGMHRLRIRGDRGTLPVSIDERNTAVYNGQIYSNFNKEDRKFTMVNDKIVDEINSASGPIEGLVPDGMFALCILDKFQKEAILRNDYYGIKPLYYSSTNEEFIFSSEIRSLGKYRKLKTIHKQSVLELFRYSGFLGNNTIFSEAKSITDTDIKVNYRNGIEITAIPKRQRFDEHLTQKKSLKKSIEQAVGDCTRGSRSLGLALSGGLDSLILAYELNELGCEGLKTISVVGSETGDGVRDLRELGLPGSAWKTWNHRVVSFESDDFYRLLQQSMANYDQPTTMSSLPLYQLISNTAKEMGVTVLLLGEGVDENFLGYNSYKKIKYISNIRDYYFDKNRQLLLSKIFSESDLGMLDSHFNETHACNSVSDFVDIENSIRLRRLLNRTDTTLMANSIEGRTPFLHRNIPSYARKMSLDDLVAENGKMSLRRLYTPFLGEKARVNKTRFKVSDKILLEILNRPDIEKKSQHFLKILSEQLSLKAFDEVYSLIKSNKQWNSDIATLLLTFPMFMENHFE